MGPSTPAAFPFGSDDRGELGGSDRNTEARSPLVRLTSAGFLLRESAAIVADREPRFSYPDDDRYRPEHVDVHGY